MCFTIKLNKNTIIASSSLLPSPPPPPPPLPKEKLSRRSLNRLSASNVYVCRTANQENFNIFFLLQSKWRDRKLKLFAQLQRQLQLNSIKICSFPLFKHSMSFHVVTRSSVGAFLFSANLKLRTTDARTWSIVNSSLTQNYIFIAFCNLISFNEKGHINVNYSISRNKILPMHRIQTAHLHI